MKQYEHVDKRPESIVISDYPDTYKSIILLKLAVRFFENDNQMFEKANHSIENSNHIFEKTPGVYLDPKS